ncbi:MAG: transglycosylase domain-containing protein [Cellulophaga sp.]
MAKAVKKTVKKKTVKNNFFKFIKWFWILFVAGVFSVAFVFLLASWDVFGEMPTFEELENPRTDLASQVISSDGKTLGKYFLNENRTPVSYSELPEHLVKALVATEDERFYTHSGIDVRGTLRAAVYLGTNGGASTITQQLSKLLFTGIRARGWKRYTQKIKEWVIATRLERQYTKQEIIEMYLNKMDFYFNAVGIRSASRIYFGKEPRELKIEEGAVLVAMLKNPRQFNPHREISKKKSLRGRNQVFRKMERNDFLTTQEKDSLQKLPIKLNFSPEEHSDGPAPYFRMYLKGFMKKWIKNTPKIAVEGERDRYNLFLDGLKIYTTIDSRMQANAEKAVSQHMKKLQMEFFRQNTPNKNKTAPFLDLDKNQIDRIMNRAMKRSERWRIMKKEGKLEKDIKASFKVATEMRIFDWNSETQETDTIMTPMDSIRYYKTILRTAMMSLEPQTGHVKAWVGGLNYKHFQYDNVIQGARQAGSTFKPFVYAAAIDQLRYSPCDELPDVQHCIEANAHGNPERWCPKNSDSKYSGNMRTLKNSLANSVNSITAQLMDKVGPKAVATIARNLGITSEILEVPSIALGVPDVNVYEMVGAYGAFANQGVYVKPVMVTRIEDKNGTVLYEYVPETRDVLSKDVAYAMVDLMKGVVESGSGGRLRHTYNKKNNVYKKVITGYPYELKNPIAGKTGTTQNQSDGWFMGMVPNLVTGVWVGGEDKPIHFKSITYGQGASMALPIWGLYMKANYANKEIGVSEADFKKPKNLSINIDCTKVIKDLKNSLDTEDDLDL